MSSGSDSAFRDHRAVQVAEGLKGGSDSASSPLPAVLLHWFISDDEAGARDIGAVDTNLGVVLSCWRLGGCCACAIGAGGLGAGSSIDTAAARESVPSVLGCTVRFFPPRLLFTDSCFIFRSAFTLSVSASSPTASPPPRAAPSAAAPRISTSFIEIWCSLRVLVGVVSTLLSLPLLSDSYNQNNFKAAGMTRNTIEAQRSTLRLLRSFRKLELSSLSLSSKTMLGTS